jgi:hypothetical protein
VSGGAAADSWEAHEMSLQQVALIGHVFKSIVSGGARLQPHR